MIKSNYSKQDAIDYQFASENDALDRKQCLQIFKRKMTQDEFINLKTGDYVYVRGTKGYQNYSF